VAGSGDVSTGWPEAQANSPKASIPIMADLRKRFIGEMAAGKLLSAHLLAHRLIEVFGFEIA